MEVRSTYGRVVAIKVFAIAERLASKIVSRIILQKFLVQKMGSHNRIKVWAFSNEIFGLSIQAIQRYQKINFK